MKKETSISASRIGDIPTKSSTQPDQSRVRARKEQMLSKGRDTPLTAASRGKMKLTTQ